MKKYDYIVIGAGPAGCFAAQMLSVKGWSVCVLEKSSEDFCKVCGDGISVRAVEVLRRTGFPLEWFREAGAAEVSSIHYLRDGERETLSLKASGKTAYVLSRRETDRLFRRFCSGSGAEIVYECRAENIVSVPGEGFEVCGRAAREVIVSTGAMGQINCNGIPLLPRVQKPLGASAWKDC